ncbi:MULTISPECIES: GNAT family N-acetyltransferase [unclassified Nitratireductor]|uniref:GNAT family N-acetyltransferase n=1 Tax=unclassified Nitratireductor TaxID=2641084 RepID=UPI0025E81A38|nr:GNAT family N-acetyltransferase [Nitratireductor sp.]
MIKTYQPGVDDDAIVAVWLRASRLAHAFLEEAFLTREADNIRNVYLPMAETRTIWVDNRLVGFISLLGNQVGGLFLDPAFHGRGLGRALMDDAVARMGTLELDVFVKNDLGRSFYARYGFVPIEERIDEPTGEPVLHLRYPA